MIQKIIKKNKAVSKQFCLNCLNINLTFDKTFC